MIPKYTSKYCSDGLIWQMCYFRKYWHWQKEFLSYRVNLHGSRPWFILCCISSQGFECVLSSNMNITCNVKECTSLISWWSCGTCMGTLQNCQIDKLGSCCIPLHLAFPCKITVGLLWCIVLLFLKHVSKESFCSFQH